MRLFFFYLIYLRLRFIFLWWNFHLLNKNWTLWLTPSFISRRATNYFLNKMPCEGDNDKSVSGRRNHWEFCPFWHFKILESDQSLLYCANSHTIKLDRNMLFKDYVEVSQIDNTKLYVNYNQSKVGFVISKPKENLALVNFKKNNFEPIGYSTTSIKP